MKKLLTILVVLAVIVIGGGLLFMSFALNSVVKTAVEEIAPGITGTSVTLESVDISPFNGKGTITGLVIGPLEGFKPERTLAVGSAEMDVDIWSVLGDHIIIELIDVKDPYVGFEQKISGGSNIDALLKNIQGDAPAEEPPPETEPAAMPRIEIKQFIFERGTVEMFSVAGGIKVPLPSLTLENLGTDEGGLPPDQMAGEVMGAVAGSVFKSVGSVGSNVLDAGGEGVKKVGEGLKGAGDKIKSLFGGN